jgi:hypothetical protein
VPEIVYVLFVTGFAGTLDAAAVTPDGRVPTMLQENGD